MDEWNGEESGGYGRMNFSSGENIFGIHVKRFGDAFDVLRFWASVAEKRGGWVLGRGT